MKFKDILNMIGKGIVSTNPIASGVLSAVNMFLPDGKKLLEGSNGEDVKKAVETLSSSQKASLMEKEVDLEIEQEKGWTSRYRAMCKADGQSTRPQIALMMARVFCIVLLAFVAIIAYSVLNGGMEQLSSPYLWQVFAAITATPAALLGKYFGELRKEQGNRLEKQNKENSISKLFNMFNKKD